ncbi:serine hydrolase [uncultured Arcticibacterium sp.]|uniref:serine hydrolase n=1 Tax=uncultured Arcticibacterium sp. TaxID=2173042 RepID=UPI0030FA4066
MNLKSLAVLLLLIYFPFHLKGQKTTPSFKRSLFKNDKLRPLLQDSQNYKIQIIYTPIKGKKIGKTQYFQYTPDQYFYPASTVKLPAVLLSLEKLNEISINKDLKYTSQSTIKNYSSVEAEANESISNYIKKILLVSDNDAFNRLYDFLGMDYFNDKLKQKGFSNTKINHRLSINLSKEENQTTPKVFLGRSYYEEPKTSFRSYQSSEKILVGKKYITGKKLINQPMDFAAKNKFDLLDQHRMLISIFYPENIDQKAHFNIKASDLNFVKDYMSRMPRNANYDETKFPDNYGKFLVFGDQKGRIPENIKIYNKIGGAYGFLIDNALIKDENSSNAMILSAVIYANKNETLNDDTYEYDSLGLPFLGELGRYLLKSSTK